MSRKRLVSALAAAAVALTASAFAQPASKGPSKSPSGGMSDAVMVTATVQAVDVNARTVTVKGPQGHVVTIKVDPSIPNLEQLKVGDEVVAKYYEALAWDVKKAGTSTLQPGIAGSAGAGKEGGGRTAIGRRSVRMVVTITAIDTAAQKVTVKEPDGPTTVIKVKNPANLQGVKVGDQVEVKFTQALAVTIELAPKK